ncbi:heterogeneous nuclear ribonucleoprotein L isoform X2 [Dermatophagoides farinae]|uniref:heterogeneous nuclear ribonucleoprotein L isoform X2 n=1 Tax=Dermatophagoides farinae TaxID=6954 RepID=UPI001F0CDE68|nr:heterogeneous nuclear ribonucleoprotein L-like isoform X2 [Dermatophagoides farinae]
MAAATYEGHSSKRLKTDQDRGFNNNNYFSHSNSRYAGMPREHEERLNHVLLLTVINPAYPITCEVIHQICSPNGKVLRIVIFKKNGIQAMVEFDSIESAKRAKSVLNGCDIYSGCCTLRVEYAKPVRLNVYKNDLESFDYTNPGLGKLPVTDDPYSHHDAYNAGTRHPAPPYMPDSYLPPGDAYRDGRPGVLGSIPNSGYPGQTPLIQGTPVTQQGGPQQGAVLMVYGLNHQIMNCDRLFNLLCQYGNVVRIKFLKSKEGCAMVQMGDSISVERSISSLNKVSFFGHEMQLGFSKQAFLNDVKQPFELPDGTPSFKDFMGNRNNRFTNPESALKNRISQPAEVLHFFNAPYGITEQDIMNIFEEHCSNNKPNSIKFFQSKTERSSSGLIQFETVSNAIEALVICNHVSIPNPNGKFPFVFKLCFSLAAARF